MTNRSALINYLTEYVHAATGDLGEMEKITGKHNCSIPMAMTVIFNLELIGYFLDDQSDILKSYENIKRSILFDPATFNSEYHDNLDDLVYYFRHGMMHGYFPKSMNKNIYEDYRIDKIDLCYNLFERNILNVVKLSKDFKKFISNLQLQFNIIDPDAKFPETTPSLLR